MPKTVDDRLLDPARGSDECGEPDYLVVIPGGCRELTDLLGRRCTPATHTHRQSSRSARRFGCMQRAEQISVDLALPTSPSASLHATSRPDGQRLATRIVIAAPDTLPRSLGCSRAGP
jgi:hypothetical protein